MRSRSAGRRPPALARGGGLAVGRTSETPGRHGSGRPAAAGVADVAGGRTPSVLIELLGELPSGQTWARMSCTNSPGIRPGPGDRGKAGRAEEVPRRLGRWWKANAASVELAGWPPGPVTSDSRWSSGGNNSNGRVAEVGRDGKIRWQVGNLKYPVDAIVLPGERVLVTEWDGNRVAEWDFKGNIIWKKEGFNGRATNAQRLSNGNTFISTTNELLEVDRAGKTVYTVRVNQGLTAGYRAANGELVCLRNDGNVVRYDVNGKELKAFASNREHRGRAGWTGRNRDILVTQPSPSQRGDGVHSDRKVVKE